MRVAVVANQFKAAISALGLMSGGGSEPMNQVRQHILDPLEVLRAARLGIARAHLFALWYPFGGRGRSCDDARTDPPLP